MIPSTHPPLYPKTLYISQQQLTDLQLWLIIFLSNIPHHPKIHAFSPSSSVKHSLSNRELERENSLNRLHKKNKNQQKTNKNGRSQQQNYLHRSHFAMHLYHLK